MGFQLVGNATKQGCEGPRLGSVVMVRDRAQGGYVGICVHGRRPFT
jgi:hypothetical protein